MRGANTASALARAPGGLRRRRRLSDLAGEWVGHITGTNVGRVVIRISASGDALDGTIDVSDREFGRTRYLFVGSRQDAQFNLKITPREAPNGVAVTPGTVTGRIQPDGTLAGIWETELGTAGKFAAKRSVAPMSPSRVSEEAVHDGPRRSLMTPLWVISIFVSLCQVVAGLAVIQAEGGVQITLTVFVVVFPVLVAGAFFAILWKKPYVFYPPTEFGAGANVSEYVQAFAGLSPTQAAERQRQLIGGTTQSNEPRPSEQDTPEAKARTQLASNVLKFFAFKRMRYTDVSDATARAVFNLGAYQGFNLFDGVPGVAFFGFFVDLEPAEIVARVRFLLNNIDLSYRRVQEQPDAAQRDAALRILDQIHVEVLVPEDAPVAGVESRIEKHRPEGSTVQVSVYKPSEIKRVVQREYESMGLTS
jgi:hypothetical protein